ncbi:hypothetical protein ACOSP7_015306 [Xanthoceras sorbifolium]
MLLVLTPTLATIVNTSNCFFSSSVAKTQLAGFTRQHNILTSTILRHRSAMASVFTKAVLLRFDLTDYEDPSEALSRLKQTTNVATYQEAFEKLSHQVDGLPKNFLIGCFIAGLRDDIRLDVKIKQPSTLAVIMGANSNPIAGLLGLPPNMTPTTFQRITSQEARARREKDTCYYCDEKYVPGHHCQWPQLFIIDNSSHFDYFPTNEAQFECAPTEPISQFRPYGQ